MSVASSLSSIASPSQSSAAGASGANPYAELDSGEFIQIMLSELSNQDPFQPNDSAAILEQLSSLRSIESDLSLQSKLESLVLQNSIGQAGALIGKFAEGLDGDGNSFGGLVTSVRINDGKAELELDSGRKLPIERVTGVFNASTDGATAGSPVDESVFTPATAAAAPATSNAAAAEQPDLDALLQQLGVGPTTGASAG